MGQVIEARIGRKYAIYLPRAIVKDLELKEGGKVLLSVSGKTLVVQSVEDPIELALTGKKFASITPAEVERISVEQQRRAVKGTS
jgi:antitoxin component of MazEF toxin-antitoxin module